MSTQRTLSHAHTTQLIADAESCSSVQVALASWSASAVVNTLPSAQPTITRLGSVSFIQMASTSSANEWASVLPVR